MQETVLTQLQHLPKGPGVYLFKDGRGEVLYVGKAKSLKSRVRSYFQSGSSDQRMFIPLLGRLLADIETVVTGSEKEAAILENNLIKQHQPRFNVKLRDDKNFLSLELCVADRWPRLAVVRRAEREGARYFGPFHSATAARRTLHLVNKHFQLRTCSDTEMASRKRPCLQHQIKRCAAPCVYDVDPTWYREQVENVGLFLDGRHDELSAQLEKSMQNAAIDMRFELAAAYRDQLRAIEAAREQQRVVWIDREHRDVIGFHREGDLAEIAVLAMRAGRLADVATYSVRDIATLERTQDGAQDERLRQIVDQELIAAFVTERYLERLAAGHAEDLVPKEILLPLEPEGMTGIAELLSEVAHRKVTLAHPQRGKKADVLRMANENARHAFAEKRRRKADVEERLVQLRDRLRLPSIPERIECCDISHLGGKDTVGAIVALTRGEIDKKRYRSFIVKGEHHEAGDDYAAMYEVLARRFRRGRRERETTDEDDDVWRLPDLLVVDGGRGQLGVALAAARDLGLHELPIVALAKEKENVLGEELVDRVYLPGQKNPLAVRGSAALMLLARARDEAHRFSNKSRERLGKSRRLESALDGVKGVGPVTKRALLLHFGGVAAIAAASEAELLAVQGVNRRHVHALQLALGGANSEAPTELSEVAPVDATQSEAPKPGDPT